MKIRTTTATRISCEGHDYELRSRIAEHRIIVRDGNRWITLSCEGHERAEIVVEVQHIILRSLWNLHEVMLHENDCDIMTKQIIDFVIDCSSAVKGECKISKVDTWSAKREKLLQFELTYMSGLELEWVCNHSDYRDERWSKMRDIASWVMWNWNHRDPHAYVQPVMTYTDCCWGKVDDKWLQSLPQRDHRPVKTLVSHGKFPA